MTSSASKVQQQFKQMPTRNLLDNELSSLVAQQIPIDNRFSSGAKSGRDAYAGRKRCPPPHACRPTPLAASRWLATGALPTSERCPGPIVSGQFGCPRRSAGEHTSWQATHLRMFLSATWTHTTQTVPNQPVKFTLLSQHASVQMAEYLEGDRKSHDIQFCNLSPHC